jgi:hypothetical protein
MTTTVTVNAHCDGANKQVCIMRYANSEKQQAGIGEEYVIQDGQYWSGVVYDKYRIIVKEVVKSSPAGKAIDNDTNP